MPKLSLAHREHPGSLPRLGRQPVVPVGDTRTIPHGMRNSFNGAYADSSPGAGDGCALWYVIHGLWAGREI